MGETSGKKIPREQSCIVGEGCACEKVPFSLTRTGGGKGAVPTHTDPCLAQLVLPHCSGTNTTFWGPVSAGM